MYRIFYPKTMDFTIFSSAHILFSRIDHVLDYKFCLGKLKKKMKSFQASFLITIQYFYVSTTGKTNLLKIKTYGG